MKRTVYLSGLLVWCLPLILIAQVEFHGYVAGQNAVRLTKPHDAMLMRSRLRLNPEFAGDRVYGFASLDVLNEVATGAPTRVNLREAYLDIYSQWLDVRFGKQQIVWGKTDGYFINDIVNPLDLSYFLLQDFDDIRIATHSLKLNFHHANNSLEAVFIPEFQPTKLNFEGDWAFARPDSFEVTVPLPNQTVISYNIPLIYEEDVLPRSTFEATEIGLKFNTFVLGTDLSLIWLRIREDRPVFYKNMVIGANGPEAINLQPEHPWLRFYGLSFARPINVWVIRGEGGYFPRRYYDTQNPQYQTSGMLVKKPFLQGMLGVDYQLTSTIDLSWQAIHERILDYEAGIYDDEIRNMASVMLRGRFFNETVSPLLLTLYNIDDKSYLTRWLVEWNFSDNFTLSWGVDLLGGADDTLFGQFDRNDNTYIKLRYSF